MPASRVRLRKESLGCAIALAKTLIVLHSFNALMDLPCFLISATLPVVRKRSINLPNSRKLKVIFDLQTNNK